MPTLKVNTFCLLRFYSLRLNPISFDFSWFEKPSWQFTVLAPPVTPILLPFLPKWYNVHALITADDRARVTFSNNAFHAAGADTGLWSFINPAQVRAPFPVHPFPPSDVLLPVNDQSPNALT